MPPEKPPVIVIDFAENRFVTVPDDEVDSNEDLARARRIQESQQLTAAALPAPTQDT